MSTKYFSGVESHEISIISGICKDIETGRITIISTEKRFKVVSPGENGYLYDWTYNFCRWGFARKARGSEHHAAQHAYCPYQHVSSILANFLDTAVDLGFYERTTANRFEGRTPNIIWM